MPKLNLDAWSVQKIIGTSGAIGLVFILVAASVKLIFSRNVDLEVLDAKLKLSNERLELAKDAVEIKKAAEKGEQILGDLRQTNELVGDYSADFKACSEELNDSLPSYKKFKQGLGQTPQAIPEYEFNKLESSLDQTQKELENQINDIFDEPLE
jgi:chorismate mutase